MSNGESGFSEYYVTESLAEVLVTKTTGYDTLLNAALRFLNTLNIQLMAYLIKSKTNILAIYKKKWEVY